MKRLLSAALGMALLAIIVPFNVGAADHNAAYTKSCNDCHNSSLPATNSTTFNSSCLVCHDTNSTNILVNHKLASTDQANTSHKWSGNAVNPSAGAQAPTTGALAQVLDYTGGQLACINCHNPHANDNNVTAFLRINNDADQICLDCHSSRNVKSHRVDTSKYPASHPVNVNYSDAATATAGGYNNPPVNANPNNSVSDLGARLTASGSVVLCSTCHDVHNAYSQSANPPVADSNGKFGDGNLLRTDPRGAKAAAGTPDKLNICTNCHAGKFNHNAKGQDVQCLDCHAAHVEYDPNDPTGAKGININLIRRNVTKDGAPGQIFYRYAGDNREYKNADGTGVCQGCHTLPTTIADHASNDPNVCNKCHTHNDTKGSFTAAMPDHKATLGAGDILVFSNSNTDHSAGFTISENCTLCHYESLLQQHGNQCSLCHSGTNPPRNSFGGAAWNKTCQQGSCHPNTIHSAMGADHNGMWFNSSSSCDLCHDGVGGFPGSGDNCTRCHNPEMTVAAVGDHLPPLTTSNAQSTYTGNASIHITAIDQGSSGVSNTWYSTNGTKWYIGTNLTLSAPTSGSRAYTLLFYSTDHAMNTEAVKSVAITVQSSADTTPPATTSSFNPAAGATFKTSQSVNLIATDNTSGVKATYFKIDSGTFTSGTSFTVPDGLHTISYYSVDNANNTEATHVSNQFRVDTIAPVTTSTAVNGNTYTGAQTFTLSATDTNGSGVASTLYKLDSGSFESGSSVVVAAPVSGSASHTISWYSTDAAGNTETTKSVSFTVQAQVTDTIPPVTVSSFNPAANAIFKANQPVTLTPTDGGSGVKATYYKIDSGAFTQGTSFTVSGDGLHTFSYYSVDNTNNTETTHVSNSFRIDTIAPVTTSTAVNGNTYTGAQTFTLTAADAGSGVASTWYKLDASASYTSGTSVAVAAPTSGSVSHTISWYSTDIAGNQETTKSVTFTVAAAVSGGGTATLIGHNSSSSAHPYTHFWVNDATDTNLIADSGWSSDEHDTGATFVVPAGVGYVLRVDWEIPDYEGGGTGSDARVVSPSETSSGATVTWNLSI